MKGMSEHTDEVTRALVQAADAARFAPSIHNTQPWRWVVRAGRLELFGVSERQLSEQDPSGRHTPVLGLSAAARASGEAAPLIATAMAGGAVAEALAGTAPPRLSPHPAARRDRPSSRCRRT